MRPFEIDDADRAAYHAAASIASNFLVTLEAAAEEVAGAAGLEPEEARALLAPLVRATVRELGRARARARRSPGRSPAATSARSSASARPSRSRAPQLLPLFDALVERTRALAGREALA